MKYYVFKYQDADRYVYLRLENKDDTEGVNVYFKRKINKAKNPGEIFSHEIDEKGNTYHSTDKYPCGYWKNPVDVATWRESQRQCLAAKQNIKALNADATKMSIQLLRQVYKKLSYSQRSAFLLKVVEEISKI